MNTLFITQALRLAKRNITYTVITMTGLIVGITTAILTFVWINFELSYNKYSIDNKRVYAILANEVADGETVTGDEIPLPYDFLVNELPEVEAAARIDNTMLKLGTTNATIEKRGVFSDSSFFNVHATDFVGGQSENIFPDNNSIAISKNIAELLFEEGDAIGKTLQLNETKEFKITAIFNSYPINSDLRHIDFVVPFNAKPRDEDDVWHNIRLKLLPKTSTEIIEQKINNKLKEVLGEDANISSMLFSMNEWRLYWNFKNGKQSGGRIVYVITFAISGILILIMSSINYMNISIARASKRAKEIGVKKITGASQLTLVKQFMLENLFFTTLAALLSAIVAYLLLPQVIILTKAPLTLTFTDPKLITGLVGIITITTILAGVYPSIILASFNPITALKGNLYSFIGGKLLRKSIIAFQFTVSIILVFSAFIIWKQIDFLLQRDLGYDRKNVINVWHGGDSQSVFQRIKTKLLTHSSIEAVAFSGASPMEINGWVETNRIENPFKNPIAFYMAYIDSEFLNTLNIKLIQGRNFSPDLASDSLNFIINKKAADLLGYKDPIGKRIQCMSYEENIGEGEIIGVINDFQHNDIHEPISPTILALGKSEYLSNIFVRYKPGQMNPALSHLTATYSELFPDKAINYSFLDSDYENQFYTEKLIRKLSICFTIISIIIATLGILSLTLFNGEKLKKEIGIRKLHGATNSQIILLLNRDFVTPIIFGLCIAMPSSFILMEDFLSSYPTRINIEVMSFLIVGGFMISIVILTSAFQSLRAANKNPIESLRSE